MNVEIEWCIRDNVPWPKLPKNVKQILGGSKSEYEKLIVEYSVKNQLRYRGNLVRFVRKVEEQYYETLLRYSGDHLMLYPYHLSDLIVKGLRVTPFQYYLNILQDLINQERSYDTLPNFTAQDCLRLLGVGRNQYIDLMNRARSVKKTFRNKKSIKDILPLVPIDVNIDFWWLVQAGSVMEDDIKACTSEEKQIIDFLCDNGARAAGMFDLSTVQRLYNKGLVYFDVPILDEDYIIVPPLNDFVMNRVSGDYFETMLYKIFISIDEHTQVVELSHILQLDLSSVKNAISVFCRLNLAHKKNLAVVEQHKSWLNNQPSMSFRSSFASLSDLATSLIDFTPMSETSADLLDVEPAEISDGQDAKSSSIESVHSSEPRRIGFIFDSTLTAFLMMGNLSSSLKNHAVTLFEAGKLTDECLDSFIEELRKINSFSEGEAQRYFEHATVLRESIEFLRSHSELDLIRCESLMALDPFSRVRLLKKNYRLMVSMAPLSSDLSSVNCSDPPHLGPGVAEVNSYWFKLFLYNLLGQGPVTFMFHKGCRVKRLPSALKPYKKLLLGIWSHDFTVVYSDSCLLTLNEALQHSVVLLQAYSETDDDIQIIHLPFPSTHLGTEPAQSTDSHPLILRLTSTLALSNLCGYTTLVRIPKPQLKRKVDGFEADTPPPHDWQVFLNHRHRSPGVDGDLRKMTSDDFHICSTVTDADWLPYDCTFGLPLFDKRLNESICRRLTECKLLDCEKSSDIRDASARIGAMVLDFIKDFQHNLNEDDYGPSQEHTVPYPVRTLLFDGSIVKIWDGY